MHYRSVNRNTIKWLSIFGVFYSSVLAWGAPVSNATLTSDDVKLSTGQYYYAMKGDRNAGIKDNNVSITYSSPNAFKRVEIISNKGTKVEIELRWDGRSNALIVGRQVTVTKDPPPEARELSRWITAFPGPCFIMGRGLSTLEDKRIRTKGSSVTFEGKAQDNTTIEAILDPFNGGVARTIIRRDASRKQILGRFALGHFKKVDGVTIATRAEYTYLSAPVKTKVLYPVHLRFEIGSASFGHSVPSMDIELIRGQKVIDLRRGIPMKWNIMRTQSSDEVLKRTDEALLLYNAALPKPNKQRSIRNWGMIVSFILTALLSILFLRRKNSK